MRKANELRRPRDSAIGVRIVGAGIAGRDPRRELMGLRRDRLVDFLDGLLDAFWWLRSAPIRSIGSGKAGGSP